MSKQSDTDVSSELEAKTNFRELQVFTIRSGIPGFDEALGQGLPTGNIYLVSGVSGSNNILFVQQILYNLVASKSQVTYYNLEHTSSDIIRDLSIYKMDIREYVDDASWDFVRLILPKMKVIQDLLSDNPLEEKIELGGTLSPLMDHFYDSVKNGRNTAIHMSYLIRNSILEDVQNMLMFMREAVRKHGGVHFLLLTNDVNSADSVAVVKDFVDSVFDISISIREQDVENIVTVQKIRNVIPKSRQIRLTIRNTGIATETIRRVD